MKIIIADDHTLVRHGLLTVIKNAYPFATIDEVTDGTDLIRKTMKGNYDIIVSDLNMPGQSGMEMIKQIKHMLPNTPLLILSAYEPEQFAIRVIKAGANGYLTKDGATDELVKAIETVKQGKKYITQEIAMLLADNFSGDVSKESHETLSDREFEVFKLVAKGSGISEIANMLSLSANTVSTYRARILEKLNLRKTSDIIKYAIDMKIA